MKFFEMKTVLVDGVGVDGVNAYKINFYYFGKKNNLSYATTFNEIRINETIMSKLCAWHF